MLLKQQDDSDDGWARKRAKFAIKNLKGFIDVKGLKVLVLGCGMGYECEELKKLGNFVIACDMNKKYIENAKKYSDKTFFCDLMEKIDQEDESFDVVYCSETVEHLLSFHPFVDECKRVLKKEGFLVITTDNPCNIRNIMRMITQNSKYFHHDGHNHYYSPRDMSRILNKNGFQILKIKTIGRWFFASLGDAYLVIAKKI
jgi:2-polyprenyl-3-methyl-5-hydroxy-6-metoxy-1,4-benzoquinol methylase